MEMFTKQAYDYDYCSCAELQHILFLQPTSILEVYSVISVQVSQPTLKLWIQIGIQW